MSNSYGSQSIEEAHRRLEIIKEDHKKQMFEEKGDYVTQKDGEFIKGKTDEAIGMAMNNRHRLIAEICEEIQEVFPEPEPMEVRRYRALVLSMDSVRHSADRSNLRGDPIREMERVALEYRETATNAIRNRLVVDEQSEDEGSDVAYIRDPVSKVRHTVVLPGYSEDYDESLVEDEKERVAETILFDPLPNNIPRV